MTHLPQEGAGAPAPPSMISHPHQTSAGHHLDRNRLRQGIASRRQLLFDLEAALVAACEKEAARSRTSAVRMDDRATWDQPMWARYLAAAARLEPSYGPDMRQLLREIDQLTPLAELPVAMESTA